MKSSAVAATALAWLMAYAAIAAAVETSTDTVVSVKGMHCAVCAKKVSKKLKSVTNVKSADVDHEKGIATVIPSEGKEVSPKAVWEAVESTGYEPTELKGPSGTFTKKPSK